MTMRILLEKWRRRRTARPGRDPLAAVPRVPAGVTAETLPDGLAVSRRLSPGRGLGDRLVRWAGGNLPVRVVLDERGAFFWGRIDGRRRLASIAGDLQERFGLEAATARWSTIEFMKQLMRRNLVELKIED